MKKQFAFPCLFVAACLYATLVIVLFVLVSTGKLEMVTIARGHALPMLFGVVSALISGYLLGKVEPHKLVAFCVFWVACRFVELFATDQLYPLLMNSVFGCMMAIQIAPKFSAAKKWRNRSAGPLLILVLGYPALYLAFNQSGIAHLHLVMPMVLLLALLLFYMGGRVITASVSKALTSKREPVPNRTQPVIEGTVIILMLLATVLFFLEIAFGFSQHYSISGGLISICGVLLTRQLT